MMMLEKIAYEAPPPTISICVSSRFRFFHTLALSHDRTQNPSPRNQDRTASIGRCRPGQARPGIVKTRHRPTPTLPRRNTVSPPTYRLFARPSQLCEARRGEARPESEPEVNLDWNWELHSRPFSNLISLGLSHSLGRSINQPVIQTK